MTAAPKPERPKTYSRYGRDAVTLIGQLIRTCRIERKLSVAELAERVGASRDLMQRIEKGDPRCGIGVVFEAAAIVGVPLFAQEPGQLTMSVADQKEKLRLLPKSIRKTRSAVKDDF